KVYSYDGEGGYEMEVAFKIVIPEGCINVAQAVFPWDDDGFQDDALFYAHVKNEEVTGVNITIYERSSGDEVANGTTKGNGEWENKNMSNGDYRWDAYHEDEKIDYGEFDVSTGILGRNIQGYGVVDEDDDEESYNDLFFWTYDNQWDDVEGEEVRIYYESNNTLYASGVTDEYGEYIEENMPEDNFTFTIAHDSEVYNSGWCHIYESEPEEPDYDEWFESHSYSTRDTGEDGKPDTIRINYDPNTEGDEVDITIWISIHFEMSGQSYNVYYTIHGEEVDDFFEEYKAGKTGLYDFEVELQDDQGNDEDYFEINDVQLYKESKIIYVDDDAPEGGNGSEERPYNKIQDGVDNATNGDTIRVFEGTYYENVVVNKTVSLIGNGSVDTTVDGGGEGDVVNITADWVNVSGFKVTGSGDDYEDAGIELRSNHNRIFENTCSDNKQGIYLYSSDNSTISNNNCSNNDKGITLAASDHNTLTNSTCSNNGYGIFLGSSDHNALSNNNMLQQRLRRHLSLLLRQYAYRQHML
ncbi:MAG: right-handed parallel beta-helix repeat-containing protein, partial [Thermoplasmata archaeon]|nr:right-handed parallel beta-helix repeat-containing protein [Thermoplasmata archaeon]